MPRRVSLPAADDLFRPSTALEQEAAPQRARRRTVAAVPESAPVEESAETAEASRRSSGRVRHDEKMTVYVTADELLDLEQARLTLRRQGVTTDRGRLVREAVAMALADLEEHGEESQLVRRLRAR